MTITDYNDDDMDGLFYTNIGDTYEVNDAYMFSGLLNSDYETDTNGDSVIYDGYYTLDSDLDSTYRFSGNDITTIKLDELKTFVDIGLPVIISDRLVGDETTSSDYDEDEIRMDRVDKASYMYDFLDYAIDKSNVFTASEIEENKDTALLYLNLTKPEIIFSENGYPTEYTGIEDVGNETDFNDQTVSYTFTITNETDPTPEDTMYSVNLYIDQDADGSYEDNELISELTITDELGNAVEENQLKSGVEYTVEKELPDSYQGAIPWKLEISIVDREYFHTSEIGYTYIQPTKIITINVLQIHETGNDLISENDYYATYIEELENYGIYEINITGITISNLNDNTNTTTYLDDNNKIQTVTTSEASSDIYENCLDEYDMLVLGFGDGYGRLDDDGGLNEAAAEAIAQYIESGKAVLFAHDTSSLANLAASSYPVGDEDEYELVTVDPSANTDVTFYTPSSDDLWFACGDYDTVAGEDVPSYDAEAYITDNRCTSYSQIAFSSDTDKWEYYGNGNKNNQYYPTPQWIVIPTQPDDGIIYNQNTGQWGRAYTKSDISYYSTGWFTSYYFNTVLRDLVGLDRYGITNSSYSSNYLFPYEYNEYNELTGGTELVANQYVYADGSSMTSTDEATLLDSGYSIAYKPTTDPNDWSYVEETQGFNDVELAWRNDSDVTQYTPSTLSSASHYIRTYTVSQVNQGQITTFPYNINTTAFDEDSSYDYLSVVETHNQYYQLNMNAEDVVVWYCLAGTNINGIYTNDVTNLYYIYNIGNVTYTGAGHSTESSTDIAVGPEEAKLFINTMIAAYRAGRVDPEITLVDESGLDFSAVYFTVDEALEASLAQEDGVGDSENLIPFTITDSNLENPDTRTISISYYEGGITKEEANETTTTYEYKYEDLTIYDSSGEEVTDASKLLTNTSYTVEIPNEIITSFIESDFTSFTIYINISSTFSDSETMSGDSVSVTLYKLGLQNLN